MKLSKLYSNKPNIFSDLKFREDGLNLIFAQIKDINNRDNDTHNLGKSTLAELIDFMMLKGKEPNFFLFKHINVFKDFVFFLEIKISDKYYLTIRRSIDYHSKIAFKKTPDSSHDFRSLDKEDWDHFNLPLKKAKKLLDSLLNLTVIKPWDYRKGISYFLRSQHDYKDVFQLSKFQGKHKDWKPYLFHILGFDGQIIQQKYEIENKIEEEEKRLSYIHKEYPGDIDSQDKIRGMKSILEKNLKEQEIKLDKFDFLFKENQIQKELVEEVENEIVNLNEQNYALNFEINKIETQLSTDVKFDLKGIEKIYEESLIYFGNQIRNDYNDLIEFNKKITSERSKFLREQLSKAMERRLLVEEQLEKINEKREKYISFLQEKDIFVKYKSAQNEIINLKAKTELLEKKLELSEKISEVKKEIKKLESKKSELIEEIASIIDAGNDIYDSIRLKFSEIVKYIINEDAIISIRINSENNIDFKAEIIDTSGTNTSQNRGTSYKRLLCAAFDIALLIIYSNKNFFHFVYHDGILEGLDNRKKIKFLEIIRQSCSADKIQHIMTVIESDWPKDENGAKLYWDEKEIIKILHDKGKEGRLFHMEKF